MKRFCLYCCLLICLSFLGCQPQGSNGSLSQPSPEATVSGDLMNQKPEKPPDTVIDAVLRAIIETTNVEKNQLQVQKATVETWSDGCLGLAKPDEICTQALVEGWRVIVSDGDQNWVYRTDRTGQIIRLES